MDLVKKPAVKVLFVCLGNICRSPLAEAIFKKKVTMRRLDIFIQADSCGTSNYHIGQEPDKRTRMNALKNGVAIQHFGRQLSTDDLEKFDLIIAMDHSNYKNILWLMMSSDHNHKVKLMRSFDPEQGDEVPDPYYGGEESFQEVFEILDRSTDGLLNHLINEFKL